MFIRTHAQEGKWGPCCPDLTVLLRRKSWSAGQNFHISEGISLLQNENQNQMNNFSNSGTQWLYWVFSISDPAGSNRLWWQTVLPAPSLMCSVQEWATWPAAASCAQTSGGGNTSSVPKGLVLRWACWKMLSGRSSSPSTGPHSARPPEFPLRGNLPECWKFCSISRPEGHLLTTDQTNT